MLPPYPLLTIAGSDSGGAAGLQADLKTWTALGGVHGMSAVTAVTAQNSARVAAVHFLPPDFVAAQIDAVLSDYGAAAIKTGFLGRVEIIETVAGRLAYWLPRCQALRKVPGTCYCVIDPVLVNHRGEAMFGPEVAAVYRELLFPLADLVTPNAAEAALLGVATLDRLPLETELAAMGARRVLVKGRRRGDAIVDVYWDGQQRHELSQPFIETVNLHGSGDTLSAAICAFLARGHDWLDAIQRARAFTREAIRRGAAWRLGEGHGPLGY